METRYTDSNTVRKKVLGVIFLILFSLAFIFSCMYKILPIGRIIVGTFGVLTYPMLLLLMLVSLAGFLGFSYRRSMKATVYFCIALLSVLLVIQSIATFKQLNLVVGFKSLSSYLNYSYNIKITLLGACGSLVCGFISILLGAMGSIVVFVILATLFLGLFIDYHYYGKYEEPHVKKLKTRAVREKVHKSDKKRTADSSPVYSFSNQVSNDDVVGEITVNESEYNSNTTIYDNSSYTQDDVVGEITNDDLNGGYAPYMAQTSEVEEQTQNNFTNDFYESKPYPGIYADDRDEDRRQFMQATFGSGYGSSYSQPMSSETEEVVSEQTSEFNFGNSFGNLQNTQQTEQSSSTFSNDIFGGYQQPETNTDDEISRILNSREDVENEVKQDVFGGSSSTGFDFNFGNSFTPEPEIKQVSEPVTSTNFGFGSIETNKSKENPYKTPVYNEPVFGSNVNDYGRQSTIKEPEPPKITISSTHPIGVQPAPAPVQKPISNPYGFNMSMPGVRYNPPPLNLLKTPKADNGDYTEEQNRKSSQLEQVLAAFNVPAKVKNIVRGPKITRYELSVPLGVSVKKIPNYEDDIAAALAAKTIVIKAPIPGSPYVGIELENDTFTSVYERELLESPEFQNFKDPLPIAIGKDISGEIVVKSLAKMVHLLIAGSTGSGKSVFMHNIILSLIYKSSPDDLRLIMIDPKKVEFNRYNGIPHLLTPEVVAGSEKAINAFKWCVKEMERRYDLMSKAGYNNIEPYNKSELVKAGQFEKFPYIVIVVDELAEIMAVNKKDVELCIQRLTQLARACGMHLIVATQRPSVDIITGVIKNNIPSRIAFSLQSGIDSKTILNATGAEKLLGQGDMIFAPTGTSSTPRLQAAYATDEEIKNVIDYVKKNNTSNFDETVNNIINSEQPTTTDEVAGGGFAEAPPKDALDSYFKTAVKLVMGNGAASISYLQRRLSIGYSRAAKIIDQMEDRGYIAPATGAKQRQILITPEKFREDFGDDGDLTD